MDGPLPRQSRWRFVLRAGAPTSRGVRTGHGPRCEALEARAVLSGTVSAGLLSPTPALVARAQTAVSGGAAAEFARYQADLQHAEASSRVTSAAFANLKADASALVQAIETAPLTSQGETQDLIETQDIMDQAFLDGGLSSSQWSQVSQQMGEALYGVVFTTNLPNQAFSDMQTVAREAHVTTAERQRLTADEQAITTAMGPNAASIADAGVSRDPLVVYYDGQVAQFVHKPAGRGKSR